MVSDVHFGVRNNSEKYLTMMESFFLETLSGVIKENSIKDLRILGDLFDCRNNINVRTMNYVLNIFRKMLTDFGDLNITILIGNHDAYYRNRLDVNSLEILKDVSDRIRIIDCVTEETINGKNIIMFPWLVDDSPEKKKFDEACKGKKKWDLCLGHFEIKGFEVTKGNVDEDGVDSGKFKNFKRVFTGHYHIRNTKGHISYLGCPYQLTWSDYGDEKGIHIYDLDKNETQFIPNKSSPTHIKINMKDVISGDKEVLGQIKGNYIKLIIEDKFSEVKVIKALSKIESLSPVKMDIDNQYVEEIDDSDVELDSINDPISFLVDYISNIELEESIESKKLVDFIKELYQNCVREND